MTSKGLIMTHLIRYFIYDEELDLQDDEDPIKEVDEREFIDFDGDITYERFTVRENGCAQVCLTKYPEWMKT
jgi:hypothetical protein